MSLENAPLGTVCEDYFAVVSSDSDGLHYQCTACGGRSMKDYRRHRKSQTHKDKVEHLEQIKADDEAARSSLVDVQNQLMGNEDQEIVETRELHGSDTSDNTTRTEGSSENPPPDPWTNEYRDYFASRKFEWVDSGGQRPDIEDLLAAGIRQFDEADENDREMIEGLEQKDEEELTMIEEGKFLAVAMNEEWYPFKKKEHLVALLLLGSTRNLLSRLQYDILRGILEVTSVKLPAWSVLRGVRQELKQLLKINVIEKTSALGSPCFGLSIQETISQELANPHVCPHIQFIPEYEPGAIINRLSQARKWRDGFSRDLRVPMVQSSFGHFYVYEPVQLESRNILVPIYFYKTTTSTFAKCLRLEVRPINHSTLFRLEIAAEPDFDSETLEDINVNQFRVEFPKLVINNGQYLKDICDGKLYQQDGFLSSAISLPNPWRERANGLIIRHVPITLYSDDTSGNQSKKWNKHDSFYFTLSGLPPSLTNQEYNIHFQATTNSATVLELGEHIVDELNDLAEIGFSTYDQSIDQKVHVMVVVLCYLGDSPMHAEITNTMNPSMALHPCRMCNLGVSAQHEKLSEKYIKNFVGLSLIDGIDDLQCRDWSTTISMTKKMWSMAATSGQKARIDDLSKESGVRDKLNQLFLNPIHELRHWNKTKEAENEWIKINEEHHERVFNPFIRLRGLDGHKDTPVEILHVVLLGIVKYMTNDAVLKTPAGRIAEMKGRWASFNTSGLNIPPIQANQMVQFVGSLAGSGFRTALQAAPFVFFPYLTPSRRRMWISLCHLSAYIFQTSYTDEKTHLNQIRILINNFLCDTIRDNAQWVNKPKFHMLIHLTDSMERFGPACLFATEKFEQFNGVLRGCSIHSNRQSPGRDVATTFTTYRLLRVLLSGGIFHNENLGCHFHAGPAVLNLFKTNSTLRQTMGLKLPVPKETKYDFKFSETSVEQHVPRHLTQLSPGGEWRTVVKVRTPSNQNLIKGSFVWMLQKEKENLKSVGCIESMWSTSDGNCVVELALCESVPEIHPFYMMREIRKSGIKIWIKLKAVECLLNVQHNCYDSACTVKQTKQRTVERRLTIKLTEEIGHNKSNSYIINSASLYSSASHLCAANISTSDVTAAEWESAMELGMNEWVSNRDRKANEADEKEKIKARKEEEKARKKEDKRRKQEEKAMKKAAEDTQRLEGLNSLFATN
ncbi:hypothetical protein DFH28DRAFT_1217996 [Melampsora americana]|nr:hypothetical protein DFH28DRAFT_1217996 [Melampsora americana]